MKKNQYYGKEMREWAKEIFSHFGQEFDATLVYEDDRLFVMDWKDKNGSGNLSTRYIVDKQKGSLILEGDSGFMTACWYNPVQVEDLVHYINSTGYFMEKMRCTDHKYTYDTDDITADLEEEKAELIKNKREEMDENSDEYQEWLSELEEDFDELEEIILNHTQRYTTETRVICSEAYDDICEKYWGAPYYEAPVYYAGLRVDPRIFLWTYGFQEGVERIRGKEFVRKDI